MMLTRIVREYIRNHPAGSDFNTFMQDGFLRGLIFRIGLRIALTDTYGVIVNGRL